jgi:2-methylcitrate dehydratase PrpD
MSKVVMIKDKHIETNFPAEWATRVKVQLTNGEEFEKVVRFPKGDPENPLSWQELTIKFQSLAMRVFTQSRCQEIIDSIGDMDHFTALSAIWKLMAHLTPATADFRRTAPAARGS